MITIISIIITTLFGWLQPWLSAGEVSVTSSTQQELVALNCELSARSGIAILNNEIELCSHQSDQILPIASISKLVSAMVFLEHNPGWETVYRMQSTDKREGGRIYLFPGDEVTAKDLFYSALIASDNTAVIGLVNLSGLTEQEFVTAMNNKVQALGLTNTHFVEPTGLSSHNVSTAREVAKFAAAALANLEIEEAVLNSEYHFKTKQGKTKTIYSTGQPLASQVQDLDFLGGKTGYLNDSGYCFVGLFAQAEEKIITVMLQAYSSINKLN